MDKEKVDGLIKIWEEFVGAQTEKAFILNPKRERVRMLAEGVLNNEQKRGLKYFPCRLITGRKDEDLKLICPCNFQIQKTWIENGECWCSLFVKPAAK